MRKPPLLFVLTFLFLIFGFLYTVFKDLNEIFQFPSSFEIGIVFLIIGFILLGIIMHTSYEVSLVVLNSCYQAFCIVIFLFLLIS